MAQVKRWIFRDPYTNESYQVPVNPRAMSSPFPEANISIRHTTAVEGVVLLFEGQAAPANWKFSGTILDNDHYEALLEWSRKRRRITIEDHYGRIIECVLLNFSPEPKRSVGKPWRHEYEMSALVTKRPTAPTEV